MNIHVYSLARRETVSIAAARAVLTAATSSPENYYRNCIDLFPLVLAPMTAAEIDGQRSLSDWQTDKNNKHTDRYDATEQLNVWSACYQADRRIISADLLPEYDLLSLPLLSSWKAWGAALYGKTNFRFGFTETLRRDAVPIEATVGHHIHGDCKIEIGYREKQLSLFSICTDQVLQAAFPKDISWAATQWHNMRDLALSTTKTYEVASAHKRAGINNSAFSELQADMAQLCPAAGLPANHHVVMPSWFLHRASNLFDAPECYDELFPADRPQPKAYISHATLYAPLR